MRNNKTDCANPWLCSALGFFLPVLGLIIGAIIGKGTGVKHALGGIVLRYVLGVMVVCWLFSLGRKVEEREEVRQTAQQETVQKKRASAGWSFERTTSPIDDSQTFALSLTSAEKVGMFDKPATLVIRSQKERREVFIAWPGYLGSQSLPVTVRFDKEEAVTENWGISTTGKSAFSPFPFADFWELVKTSRRLAIQLSPYRKPPTAATFDLGNIPPEALAVFD